MRLERTLYISHFVRRRKGKSLDHNGSFAPCHAIQYSEFLATAYMQLFCSQSLTLFE